MVSMNGEDKIFGSPRRPTDARGGVSAYRVIPGKPWRLVREPVGFVIRKTSRNGRPGAEKRRARARRPRTRPTRTADGPLQGSPGNQPPHARFFARPVRPVIVRRGSRGAVPTSSWTITTVAFLGRREMQQGRGTEEVRPSARFSRKGTPCLITSSGCFRVITGATRNADLEPGNAPDIPHANSFSTISAFTSSRGWLRWL